MTATATTTVMPRIVHLSLEEIYASSGPAFYGDFVHRAVASMQRARKSVLFAKPGMGKSQIAARVAVTLALADRITVVGGLPLNSSIITQLREAGYDGDIVVHTPQSVARDQSKLDQADVLLVCLDSLDTAGARGTSGAHVAAAAAKASRVVMYGTPTQRQLDYLNVLADAGAEMVAIHAS